MSLSPPSSRIVGWRFAIAHPINNTLSGAHDRLIPFLQKFGQNRKVLHWIVRTFRVGLNIDNVGRRMPGKILLEGGPGAGQDPAASIKTRDRSAENITRERKGYDIATGRTSVERLDKFPDFGPRRKSCRQGRNARTSIVPPPTARAAEPALSSARLRRQ